MIRSSVLLISFINFGIPDTALAETAPASIISEAAVTGKQAAPPAAAASADSLKAAGATFIQRVNYARVALALNNAPLAKQHITEAQRLLGTIRASNPEQLRMVNVGAGRVSYKDNEGKFYYPIETGPILLETTKQGSVLNRGSLAVTDAEIAYVTLDFRDNDADKLLAKTLQNIDSDDLKDAQANLGSLMNKVVTTNSTEVSVPLDRARDNIALARSFIAMENYNGARFALKHADKALDEMEKDQRYSQRKDALGILRVEVASLQKTAQKNDPSVWAAADTKMKQWWTDLKSWTGD